MESAKDDGLKQRKWVNPVGQQRRQRFESEQQRLQRERVRDPYPTRLHRPGAEGTAFMSGTSFSIFDYDIVGFFRKIFLSLYVVAKFIIDFVLVLVRFVLWIASILYPWLIFWALVTILWYLIVIYWAYVVAVVVTIVIPILNVLIIIFNFLAELFIIFWDIGATIWNCIVPFLGMILYVVINVVLTILKDIFDVIGSIDWEPIVSAFMEIVNVLVEISMQILLILIKVGGEILKAVANIIGPLLEIFMEFVKIWAPVVAWVFKLLFKILYPILELLGALFGTSGSNTGNTAFTGPDYTSKGSSSTARRLLGLDRFSLSDAEKTEIEADFDRHIYTLPDEGLSDEERDILEKIIQEKTSDEHDTSERDTNDIFAKLMKLSEYEEDVHARQKQKRSWEEVKAEIIKHSEVSHEADGDNADVDANTGRKLHSVEQPWKMRRPDGLKFMSTDQDKGRSNTNKDKPEASHLDDIAHNMAHHMYVASKEIPLDDYQLARQTMDTVLRVHAKNKHFGLNSIIQNIGKKYTKLMPEPYERVSSVDHGTPKNPQSFLPSFHEDAAVHYSKHLERNGGRRLMENYKDVKGRRMSDIRIEDAKRLYNQYEAYRNHHDARIKVAMVTYGAVTRSLKHSMQEIVTPQLLIQHYSEILEAFGYRNIEDVRQEFLTRYGDAWGFLLNISYVTEHPIIRSFKKLDPNHRDSPFYHDWVIEHSKLQEERVLRSSGRRLFQSEGNVQGSQDSQAALSGFATIANLGCFGSPPHNPLCLPFIPLDTKIRIGLIKLTAHQKQIIESPTTHCTPWRFTNCIICVDRLWNACVEVLFLFSSNPYTNYPIATLVEVLPWTKTLVDWIFIVPKYGYPTTYQWVCFAYHLYDLYVIIVALWLIGHVVMLLWELATTTWANIQVLFYSGREPSWFAKCMARDIRRRMLNLEHTQSEASRHPLTYIAPPDPSYLTDEDDDEGDDLDGYNPQPQPPGSSVFDEGYSSDEDNLGGQGKPANIGFSLRKRNVGKKTKKKKAEKRENVGVHIREDEQEPGYYQVPASERQRMDVIRNLKNRPTHQSVADSVFERHHQTYGNLYTSSDDDDSIETSNSSDGSIEYLDEDLYNEISNDPLLVKSG